MKINIDVFLQLMSIDSSIGYEKGGILGGNDGVINRIAFDQDNDFSNPCSYTPNIDYLNKIIEDWMDSGNVFMGIFHTHLGNSKNLSAGDREYIIRIMKAMPNELSSLYFPIISLPEKNIICYVAKRINDGVSIYTSDLEVIGGQNE